MKRISIIFFATVLTGCGVDEFQDLREFVKNAGADMRGKIPPAPDVKAYEPFSYDNATNLTDPFKPRKAAVPKNGNNQPDLDRAKEELEAFSLETLKMVGYLKRGNVNYGLVRAPDSKVHRVIIGNYMGLDFGKILEITGNEIKIKEMVQDSSGDWTDRVSTLQLVED